MSKLDTPEFPQIERFSRSLLHRVLEPKFAKLCSMYERGRGSIFDKQCETNCNKPVSSGQSFQSYVLVKSIENEKGFLNSFCQSLLGSTI